MVTHGLDTVESMCDGAAWLEEGQLQLIGTGPEVAAAYMNRVNAAERAQRDRVAAEAAADVVAAGGEASDDEAKVEDVTITSVEFLDGSGSTVGVGIYGDPFTIRIHYDAVRPVPSPVIGIALHSISDVHITGTNTKIGGLQTPTLSGPGHVDFSVDALPLTSGDYELTVAISDEFVQHNFDRREREWRLAVRHGAHPEPEGLVELGGAWSVSATD